MISQLLKLSREVELGWTQLEEDTLAYAISLALEKYGDNDH